MTNLVAVHFAPVDGWPLRYCAIGEDFEAILQVQDGDRYLPNVYKNVFSIDSDMIIVVAETLVAATNISILAMLDHFYAHYEDGVREGYEDMVGVDYATWLMPILKGMAEIASHPVECTLEEFRETC